MNERIITESGNLISSADNWGVTSLSVFFTLLVLSISGFFMWFIVKELKKSVDNNTQATRETGEINKEIARSIQYQNSQAKENIELTHKISRKQDEIHSDVKEILNTSRYKCRINSYDRKGVNNGKNDNN